MLCSTWAQSLKFNLTARGWPTASPGHGSYLLTKPSVTFLVSILDHTPPSRFHSRGYFATAFTTHALIKVSGFFGSLKQGA